MKLRPSHISLLASAAVLALAACSPAAEKKAETPAAETTAPAATEPAANATAAAPEAPAAPEAKTAEAAAPAAAPAAPAAAGATVLVKDAAGTEFTGDPAKGQAVFRQCQTCHVLVAGQNKVGPSLAGIFGRTAGTVPGFRYSEANKNSGIVWDAQEMFVYLENPRGRIPGTIMSFVGIKNPQQRADVIAYIKANGG